MRDKTKSICKICGAEMRQYHGGIGNYYWTCSNKKCYRHQYGWWDIDEENKRDKWASLPRFSPTNTDLYELIQKGVVEIKELIKEIKKEK